VRGGGAWGGSGRKPPYLSALSGIRRAPSNLQIRKVFCTVCRRRYTVPVGKKGPRQAGAVRLRYQRSPCCHARMRPRGYASK